MIQDYLFSLFRLTDRGMYGGAVVSKWFGPGSIPSHRGLTVCRFSLKFIL